MAKEKEEALTGGCSFLKNFSFFSGRRCQLECFIKDVPRWQSRGHLTQFPCIVCVKLQLAQKKRHKKLKSFLNSCQNYC